ncbi:MAG: hypothetical protein NVSMB18_13680 [Acetobacteraceae bacterium]
MRRVLLILALLLLALPVAAVIAVRAYLDGDALRARAQAAVLRATGRELSIIGPVRLVWSLVPTIEAADVRLANPPGLSRPDFLRVERVQAQVALLPLLSGRVEVRRLALVGPDVLLERDAAGRPNWVLSPPAAAPSIEPAAPSAAPRMQVVVGSVTIEGARLAWRDKGGVLQAVSPGLSYAPESGEIVGTVLVNGVAVAVSGSAGPVAGAAWPLSLQLAGGGVSAMVAGTTAQARVTVAAPDLATSSALAGQALPSVRDVKGSATLSASGLSGVQVEAGAAAFGDVRLVRATGSADAADQPVTLQAQMLVGALPVNVAAQVGSLGALLGHGPIPLQVSLSAEDATLAGQGSVASLRGDGLDLAISGGVPDLGRLGGLAGVSLPTLRGLSLQGRVSPAPGGVQIRGLRLTAQQGDLAGDVALGWAPRPFLRGTLVSQRLDLDGVAMVPIPAATPAAPASAPTPAVAAAPAAAAVSDRAIPDRKLPFAQLRRADADLQLTIAEALWHGVAYRAVQAHLLLQDGRLRLDPLAMQGQGGPIQAQVAADGAAEPPSLAVSVKAPGLAAGPALAMLGAPESAAGTLDVDVQLSGRGETLRGQAATLDGHVGLAMVDGEIENRWLLAMLAEPLRAARLPVDTGGTSRVRCFAVRADAAGGRVKLGALALDASKLQLDGEGGVNLADETLDLHLRPQLRLGTLLAAPVRIGGTFRAPKAALDAGVLAPGRVGVTIGGPPPGDTCEPALVLARGGGTGPAPAAPEPARKAKPADLLRSLLR